MKNILFISVVFLIVTTRGLPVQKKEEPSKKEEHQENNVENVLEYERYLKEVVEALESDPEFRKKLDKAPEADIRSGKIAQELEYVSHHVRSKLDEIKRKELERLRQLANKRFELNNEIDREHLKITEHLNHENAHTFEIEDLEKLIHKTSKDLAEADRKRREEFKQYEMQKEYEKRTVLNELDEEGRKKYEEELKKQREKHNKHEKVHHPGNKAQLEEVWEKQDHMEGQEFDPKAFFMMHDLDGNEMWDETELKALFVKELDKVYQSGVPEDDLRERAEEMERMREHVFQEADTNKDGLISFQEFLDQTKREEFRKDPEWETVDNIPQFSPEEYLEYERRREAEVQRLIEQGAIPSTPKVPEGYQQYHRVHPNQLHPNQMYVNQPHPNQAYGNQVHPNQAQPNQAYGNQAHPNQAQPNQAYGNQAHPNQAQPNQAYGNQVHPNQAQPNQAYGNQAHPNQVQPNQAYGNQAHPNQAQPNQAYGNQAHPNQAQPNQAYGNQAQPNQAYGNQVQPNQAHPNQAQPNQAYGNQAQPNQVYGNQAQPNQAQPSQAYGNQAQPNQAYGNQVHPNQIPSQQNPNPNNIKQ